MGRRKRGRQDRSLAAGATEPGVDPNRLGDYNTGRSAPPKEKGISLKQRLSQLALLNPGPLPYPETNWFPLPNDWFARIQWLREYHDLHRAVGPIKVMEYLLKWTWGMRNYDRPIALSVSEFMVGRLGDDGVRRDRGTGLGRQAVIDALAVLLEADWIERVDDDHNNNNNNPYRYLPKQVRRTKTRRTDSSFRGFPRPGQNFFAMPQIWTDLTATTDAEILIVCVEYLARHQWGFNLPEGESEYRPVGLTVEEIAHGRLNAQAGRYDSGTGYTPRAIRIALDQALQRWQANFETAWIVWKDSTKGRLWYLHLESMQIDPQTSQWGGAMRPVAEETDGDQTVPGEDQIVPGRDQTVPGRQPAARDQTVPGRDQNLPGRDQTRPGADQSAPGADQTAPAHATPFIIRDNLIDNRSNNPGRQSPSSSLALTCAIRCDFDDDGFVSEKDLRQLLRAAGVKDVRGAHGRILAQEPRVSPATIIGWYLANYADPKVDKPARYTATVLQNDPADRDQVPWPFARLAAQPPEVWTLFAEWAWRRRHHYRDGTPMPGELKRGPLAKVYEEWLEVYGDVEPEDLPLDLGQEAAERVAQLRQALDAQVAAELAALEEELAVGRSAAGEGRGIRAAEPPPSFEIPGTRLKSGQVWQAALGELRLQMTKPTFDTWLKPSRVIGYEDDTFIVSVETVPIKDWLERKLLSSIKRSLSGILGRPVEVRFVVAEDVEQGRGLNAVTPTIGRKAAEHWRDALDELRLGMAKPTFDTWIEPCKPLAYEDGEFVIAVPSEAHKDWLERRLLSPIKRALSGIMSRPVEVAFVVVGS